MTLERLYFQRRYAVWGLEHQHVFVEGHSSASDTAQLLTLNLASLPACHQLPPRSHLLTPLRYSGSSGRCLAPFHLQPWTSPDPSSISYPPDFCELQGSFPPGKLPTSRFFPLVNCIWQLLSDSPVPLRHNQCFVCRFRLGIEMQLGTVSHFPKSYCVLKKKNLSLNWPPSLRMEAQTISTLPHFTLQMFPRGEGRTEAVTIW